MSFGFGFALPAYQLRGGGGNNPFNQSGPTLDLSFTGNAGNLSGADTFTLDTNFITPQYQVAAQYAVWVDGSGMTQRNFADIVTFTRASTATYFNSAGTLTTAAINEARFDYNPSTLAAQGLLIEEQRTNSIRNNTMQGAVAGTPGTAPTNWSIPTPSGGLSSEVIGTGTENGVTYIDVRYSGTATSTAIVLSFDTSTQIAALNGQNWAGSLWIKNITSAFDSYNLRISLRDSGGAALASIDTLIVPTTTLARFSGSGTLANASVAFVQPQLRLGISVGVAYDVTIRIGLPQLEQGAFATSVIPTTTTALTRSADVASINTLSPWFNATEGTLFAEAQSPNAAAFFMAQTFSDGTASNEIRQGSNSAGANLIFVVTASFVSQAGISVTLAAGTAYKAASAYTTNDFSSAVNGTLGTPDTSGTVPTVDRLTLGARGNNSLYLNGYLRRITYYPRRLSNADLQTITA